MWIMATVIFDFDSTLITCESLEEILKEKGLDAEILKRIKEITAQGMSGKISFISSLEKRLGIASVSKKDFITFGLHAGQFLTPGMEDLVKELIDQKVQVWIVSGAVRDAMVPVAKRLGIPDERLLGIDLKWSNEGKYTGVDASKPLNRSKWEGAKEASMQWMGPKIAVGDGMTDYALYEHGLVDSFVAFTQNVRRQAIVEKEVLEAKNVLELDKILKDLIHGRTVVS